MCWFLIFLLFNYSSSIERMKGINRPNSGYEYDFLIFPRPNIDAQITKIAAECEINPGRRSESIMLRFFFLDARREIGNYALDE